VNNLPGDIFNEFKVIFSVKDCLPITSK